MMENVDAPNAKNHVLLVVTVQHHVNHAVVDIILMDKNVRNVMILAQNVVDHYKLIARLAKMAIIFHHIQQQHAFNVIQLVRHAPIHVTITAILVMKDTTYHQIVHV